MIIDWEAKNNANQTIRNLSNLNNAQKDAEKNLVNSASTLEQVQQNLQTAQQLDNAMGRSYDKVLLTKIK